MTIYFTNHYDLFTYLSDNSYPLNIITYNNNTYYLNNDITFNDDVCLILNNENFNGQNHTLTINYTALYYLGFFMIQSTSFKMSKISNLTIYTTNNCVTLFIRKGNVNFHIDKCTI